MPGYVDISLRMEVSVAVIDDAILVRRNTKKQPGNGLSAQLIEIACVS